jgi:ribose transport system permease protein
MSVNNRQKILNNLNIFNKNSIAPSLVVVYIIMIVIFTAINPRFFSLGNFKGIFATFSIAGIMAVGLSTVVISGNFDMSIGSTFGLAVVVVAKLFNLKGVTIPIPVIILAGVSIGLIIGAINGFFVTKVGINSIITTLATLAVFRGLTFYYSLKNISIPKEAFLILGRYFVFGLIPLPFIYFILALIGFYIFLRFSRHGRNMYLVGANSTAARFAGVNNSNTQFLAFIISGLAASVAGVITAAQVGFANATFGNGYEFRILTICVLGGISLIGGRGTLVGVLISALIIGSISNGLALIDVPINWRDAFTGIILIAAILIDSIRVSRRERLRL